MNVAWRKRAYYSKAKFKREKIGFVVNPFKPLLRSSSFYRFNRCTEDPLGKALLRALATYFGNVIHGLDAYLRPL